MRPPGFRAPLYHGLLGIAAAVIVLVASCALFRFELVLGPLVIRSQWGNSYPLPQLADGLFQTTPSRPLIDAAPPMQRPHNVVLIIGDGMGLSMVSSASALLHGPAGGLALEEARHVGLMRTFAANALVTDSAAAGTAMATGHKTMRKRIATLPDGRQLRTLLEAALAAGMATGFVTTSGLMDATPGCFLAHDSHRDNEEEILVDILRSGVRVMIGASWGHLRRLDRKPELAAALAEARAAGYTVVTADDDLEAATAPLVALLPPRPGAPEAGGPPLQVSVHKAITELAADNSRFLLVVESEETDEWGHENDIARIVQSVSELDAAIRTVLALVAELPDTLVLITADHDTGGLGLVRGRLGEGRAKVRWTHHQHTATWVPLFAFGPGAEQFAGVFDNTDLADRLGTLLELPGFPASG